MGVRCGKSIRGIGELCSTALNWTTPCRTFHRNRTSLCNALMWTSTIVVVDIRRHILGREDRIEACRKVGVTIVKQKAERDFAILDLPAQVTRLLRYPRTRWVCGATSQMHASAAKFDEKQHVQSFQPGGFDGEEVTGNHLVLVVRQKRAPTSPLLASFGRRRDMPSLEDIADRGPPDIIAELAQFPLRLAVAPGWILLRQPDDERLHHGTDQWST